MERLRQMSLKKAFFCLTVSFLFIALVLSVLSILGISEILRLSGPSIEIKMDAPSIQTASHSLLEPSHPAWYRLLSTLQFVLPVFFVLAGLLGADWLFYRIKLKKPLAELQSGAMHIMNNNLDFSISFYAKDELGQLCNAFESMRCELVKSNKKLWRQAEERKRLNAAFSHDLRNPVTVLKGSVKLLKKGLAEGQLANSRIDDTLSLIEEYSGRIENYIETMSNTQRLEEINCTPVQINWSTLMQELSDSLAILSRNKKFSIHSNIDHPYREISVDKFIVYNVAENLVSNAIRYTDSQIDVIVSCDDSRLTITVQDDGRGFPKKILCSGAEPFSRGEETSGRSEHFGMGLYICQLLCEKHGGKLILQNTGHGAQATASFNCCRS